MYYKLICLIYALLCGQNFILVKSGCYSDFTSICLMGKSSRHISDSDSDVSDGLSPKSLSLRVIEHENALCNQDKLFSRVFCENKKLNLELESAFSKIASL
jgi:hypothetical protein